MGTVGLIGVFCCVLWIALFNTSEAGELREGNHNRTMMAQARDPQAVQGAGTRTPDSAPVKPSQAGAPPGEPSVSERDPAEKRFQITSYLVEGNAILEQAKVDSVLQPYQGSDRKLSDIESARSELEKAYHTAGYPTVVVMLPDRKSVV